MNSLFFFAKNQQQASFYKNMHIYPTQFSQIKVAFKNTVKLHQSGQQSATKFGLNNQVTGSKFLFCTYILQPFI